MRAAWWLLVFVIRVGGGGGDDDGWEFATPRLLEGQQQQLPGMQSFTLEGRMKCLNSAEKR